MSIYVISFVLGIASSVAAAFLLTYIANRSILRFSFRRVLRDILKLRRLLEADNYRPDLLVGIDRNGSIVGSILAGHLGPSSILSAHTQTTRKSDGYRELVLSDAHNPPVGSLAGKTILLVGCFVDTGKTAEAVYEYYKARSDRPDVRVAALYTSPSPILKPKYHVYVIGRDINVSMTRVMHKMPWMSEEWKFSFAGER